MRNGLLGSIAALVASAGLAVAQGPGLGLNSRTGSASPVLPVPTGTAPIYEPLNTPVPPAAAETPAVQMFGYGVDAGFDGSARHFERYWAHLDYILWSVRNIPETWPLIVSGTIPGGAIPGSPGSLILFGGSPIDVGTMSGSRVTAGGFLPGSNYVGLQASGIILPKRTVAKAAVGGPLGFPVLGTPFINDLTAAPGAAFANDSLLASSAANPGSISASAHTMLWTGELDLFGNLYRGPAFTWNLITGFRHFNLAEGMNLHQSRTLGTAGQTFEGTVLAVGSQTEIEDQFQTTNRFYGWQLGFDFEYRWRCFSFNAGLHSAIGAMREAQTIMGFTQAITGPAANRTTTEVQGGLLTQTTNIGRRTSDQFAWIPEVTGEVGYQFTRAMRFSIGYSYIYASNVVRPGNLIDPRINPTLVPTRPEFGLPLGNNHPIQVFPKTDFWAQGVNFALTIMY